MSGRFTYFVFQSPGFLIHCFCGVGGWNFVCNICIVSAVVQYVRIGEICEQAYAAGEGAEC